MTFVYVVTQFVPFFYRSRASGNVPLEIQIEKNKHNPQLIYQPSASLQTPASGSNNSAMRQMN
jgi:hypothetical protein